MKLETELRLCPICEKLMDNRHNYEVTLASGLVLGPVCSSECAHSLYLAYHAYYRVTDPEGVL